MRFRSAQQFFKFLLEEGEIDASPMRAMRPPIVPEQPVAVVSTDELERLIRSVSGRTFAERRDMAIIRLCRDTGMRLSELAGLQFEDLDFEADVAGVMGKGRRLRACPFGNKTALALQRYLRERARRPDVPLESTGPLWLGIHGPMSPRGIAQMVGKRAKAAGLPHIHPHQLRHTFAHTFLDAGGSKPGLRCRWRSIGGAKPTGRRHRCHTDCDRPLGRGARHVRAARRVRGGHAGPGGQSRPESEGLSGDQVGADVRLGEHGIGVQTYLGPEEDPSGDVEVGHVEGVTVASHVTNQAARGREPKFGDSMLGAEPAPTVEESADGQRPLHERMHLAQEGVGALREGRHPGGGNSSKLDETGIKAGWAVQPVLGEGMAQ